MPPLSYRLSSGQSFGSTQNNLEYAASDLWKRQILRRLSWTREICMSNVPNSGPAMHLQEDISTARM